MFSLYTKQQKLEAFAEGKLNEKLKCVVWCMEDIVEKGENAGFPALSPFPPQCLLKISFSGPLKVEIAW